MRETNRGLTGLLLTALLGCEPALLPEDAGVGGAAAGGGTGEGVIGGGSGEGVTGDAARPDAAVEPAPCDRGALGLCETGARVGARYCGWDQMWGPCVAPVDACGDGLDNDTDGVADDHCAPEANGCVPGAPDMCPEWFQICIWGFCVDDEWNLEFPRCTDSADCPGFATCDDGGLCVPRDCDWTEEDCSGGQYCGEGLCRTPRCPLDAYEPDDTPQSAHALVAGAPPQLRSLCLDADWLTVDTAAGEAYRLRFDAQIGQRVVVGDGPTLADPSTVEFVAAADGPLRVQLDRGSWPASLGTPSGVRVSLDRLGPALPAGAACAPAGDALCETGLRCSRAPGAEAATCRPAPRVDTFTVHPFDGFATAFTVEGFAPDGLPDDVRLMRGDGRPTWGSALWVDRLPDDRFERVFVDLDVPEWEIGGILALTLADAVGPFFASVTDAPLAGPRAGDAGARCDAYGAVRVCRAGLSCARAEDHWAGVCAPAP